MSLLARLGGLLKPADVAPTPEELALEDKTRLLAKQLLVRGQTGDAMSALEPVLARAQRAGTVALAARIALVQGLLDRADRLVAQGLAIDADDTASLEVKADLHEHRGEFAHEAGVRLRLIGRDTKAPPWTAMTTAMRAVAMARERSADTMAGAVGDLAARFEALSGVPAREQAEFAGWLFRAGDEARARRLWAAAAPCTAGWHDELLRWTDLDSPTGRSALSAPVLRAPHVPAGIATFHGAAVLPGVQWCPALPDRHIVLRDWLTRPLRRREQEPRMAFQMGNAQAALVRMPDAVPHCEQRALLVGGLPQYYHFTIEHLPRVLAAEAAGVMDDATLIVVNEDIAPFQRQQLAHLGYGDDRLLLLAPDGAMTFRELVAPLPPAVAGTYVDPQLPALMRRRMAPHAAGAHASLKLYVPRPTTGLRKVANQDDVIAMLEKRGFQTVRPEGLDAAGQAALFSHARAVVGPTGAAFANIVYAPRGAAVVPLYNRWSTLRRHTGTYYDTLAQACGHEFEMLLCDIHQVAAGEKIVNADLVVDIDDLAATLDQLGV